MTQLSEVRPAATKALRDAGAVEVHMRVSSPPVTHLLLWHTDSQDQLIASTKPVKEIAQQIEDSLSQPGGHAESNSRRP